MSFVRKWQALLEEWPEFKAEREARITLTEELHRQLCIVHRDVRVRYPYRRDPLRILALLSLLAVLSACGNAHSRAAFTRSLTTGGQGYGSTMPQRYSFTDATGRTKFCTYYPVTGHHSCL